MSRDPFRPASQQFTEFGFGEGRFPNPAIDYSDNGIKSGIPIADPDRRQQYLDLAAAKRTDLGDPNVRDLPGFMGTGNQHSQHPDYYSEGNTERYGANPPLVRERRKPPPKKRTIVTPHRMERHW